MYQRVLVVVDTEKDAQAAIIEGIALARLHEAQVQFVSVLPECFLPVADVPVMGALSPADFMIEATRVAQRRMAAAERLADQAGVPSACAIVEGANPAQGILELARSKRCDLIVVASTGRNAIMRLLNGSAIPGLITSSQIPVLVVRRARPIERVRPRVGSTRNLPVQAPGVRPPG